MEIRVLNSGKNEMEMDSQSRRGSRIGEWKGDNTGRLRRRGEREGMGKEETKPSVKRVSRKDLKAESNTGVRTYQVVYESIIAAT